jgi:hypothetical protein
MRTEVLERPAVPEQRLDTEVDRLGRFQEALGQIESVQLVDIPMNLDTPQPVQDTAKYFLDMEKRPGVNLYLDPDAAPPAEAGTPSFVPFRSRNKHSAHGVFFGTLQYEDGTATPVAVKPHDIAADQSCTTDYFTNTAARELNLETLKPVGMIVGAGDTAYSMTALEPIDTLDNIDWKTVIETEGYEGETMMVWGQVARQAGMLHSLGQVAHGDLAARNVAISEDERGVFFIDWEHADISTLAPRDAEARYDHSRKDMGELMESLARPLNDRYKAGIDLFQKYENPWQGFRDLVFDEYVATRMGFAEASGDIAEVRAELHELELSLKSHLDLILR